MAVEMKRGKDINPEEPQDITYVGISIPQDNSLGEWLVYDS